MKFLKYFLVTVAVHAWFLMLHWAKGYAFSPSLELANTVFNAGIISAMVLIFVKLFEGYNDL